MKKIINIEDRMRNKVSRLIYMDFKPSEIAIMLNKPLVKIHEWMSK